MRQTCKANYKNSFNGRYLTLMQRSISLVIPSAIAYLLTNKDIMYNVPDFKTLVVVSCIAFDRVKRLFYLAIKFR